MVSSSCLQAKFPFHSYLKDLLDDSFYTMKKNFHFLMIFFLQQTWVWLRGSSRSANLVAITACAEDRESVPVGMKFKGGFIVFILAIFKGMCRMSCWFSGMNNLHRRHESRPSYFCSHHATD